MVENRSNALGIAALAHPAVLADPYGYYRRLREADPILRDEEMRVWVLTRYADVSAILRDPRFSSARIEAEMRGLEEAGLAPLRPLFEFVGDMMLFSDPPKHTRLRRIVNKAFTPRVIEGMRESIQRVVDELLDAVQARGRMDVIRDLAYPLPTTVIAEMLGVPSEERDQFKEWSDDFAVFLGTFQPNERQMARALRSIREISEYFRGTVSHLRRTPRANLLSALARAEDEGDALSEQELLANALLLLAAGHETTTNLIGNGLLALLQHPDQLDRLKDDPALIASAVEECLRFSSPVQLTTRVVLEDLEIGGKAIWHNQYAVLLIGAANRDPDQFPDPDRFDIDRPENRHLAFGHGPHFCLGAPLARLEGQIAIGSVIRRLPDLRLATDRWEWQPTPTFRGLRALPVTF